MNPEAKQKINEAFQLVVVAQSLLLQAAKLEPDAGYKADIWDGADDARRALEALRPLL